MTRKLGTLTAAVVGSHPDDVAFVVDDGRGRTVAHRAGDTVPLASAIKVVHLAAYARAVASGELDPAEPVPLSKWKRWYLPNTDGGAHPKALQRLGVTEPDDTVTLEQMVTAMIQESDIYATDSATPPSPTPPRRPAGTTSRSRPCWARPSPSSIRRCRGMPGGTPPGATPTTAPTANR